MLSDFFFATQPYTATFFIKSGLVSRIEFLSSASKLQCTRGIPFENALAALSKEFGDSPVGGTFSGSGSSIQSFTFSTKTMDVSLHFSISTEDCSTRVVYKIREVKDASEL